MLRLHTSDSAPYGFPMQHGNFMELSQGLGSCILKKRYRYLFRPTGVALVIKVLHIEHCTVNMYKFVGILLKHCSGSCVDKVSENENFLSSLLSQRQGSPLCTRRRPCLEDRQRSPARLFYYKLSTDWHVVGQSSF
jgi:hypothetical protein